MWVICIPRTHHEFGLAIEYFIDFQASSVIEPCAVGLIITEGTCEIKAVVEGLSKKPSLRPGFVITAVDGENVSGDTISAVLALGVIGSSVSVRALRPKTQTCSSQFIEVELKRRQASTGTNTAHIQLFAATFH